MTTYDVVIVGAGPTGLYATYYAGFRELRVALVDSLSSLGGQISAIYPEKPIYDVAGFPSILGRELVSNLVEQAMTASPDIFQEETITDLQQTEQGLQLTSSSGQVLKTRALLITAGIGAFSPRPLALDPGKFAKDVAHFVTSFDEYTNQDVVVIGGGDSALDWAIGLHPFANSVTIVHRREQFRAHEASVSKARDLGIAMLLGYELAALNGEDGLRSIEVKSTTGESIEVPTTKVIAALGFIADLGSISTWGLNLSKRHIVVDSTCATNLPMVFAAGDITTYPGKVPLISVGFGEAATAINNLAAQLDDNRGIFPGHSSGTSN